jgi:hypothetical protein
VPDPQKGFIDEVLAAGRGVAALLVGDRRAAQYFDFSDKGLVGSFIGLLAVTFISALLPFANPGGSEGYSIARSTVGAVILFATQTGFVFIVLRQVKRLDGLRPYLVADNWANVYISIGTILLSFVGFQGDIAIFALAILVIVVEINIARLIVTLPPLQVAMFMIAQLVGVSIALIVLGVLFPSAEVQAAISSLQP